MTSIAFEAAVSGIIGAIDRTSKAAPSIAKAANNAVKGIFSKETWEDAIESVVENVVGKVANKGLEEAANLGISNTHGKTKGNEEEEQPTTPTQEENNNPSSNQNHVGEDHSDDSFGGTMENSYSDEPGGAVGL